MQTERTRDLLDPQQQESQKLGRWSTKYSNLRSNLINSF